jgi:hypothetical protein
MQTTTATPRNTGGIKFTSAEAVGAGLLPTPSQFAWNQSIFERWRATSENAK